MAFSALPANPEMKKHQIRKNDTTSRYDGQPTNPNNTDFSRQLFVWHADLSCAQKTVSTIPIMLHPCAVCSVHHKQADSCSKSWFSRTWIVILLCYKPSHPSKPTPTVPNCTTELVFGPWNPVKSTKEASDRCEHTIDHLEKSPGHGAQRL